ADKTISGKIAKEVFEAMCEEASKRKLQVHDVVVEETITLSADAIIENRGLRQITDESAIVKAIEEVMAKSPGQLADYRSGKDKLFGFFVGQVMKATQGKANPDAVNRLLKEKLKR